MNDVISPIHYFVDAPGNLYPASQTDQHHTSMPRRTVGEKLVVSMGLWFPNQQEYQPFQDARLRAAEEAAVLDERGYRPTESRPRLSESAWEAHNFNRQNGGPSAKLRRAAFLHLVKGYNKTAAVRAAGFDNEENGRRTLRRFVKANFPHLGE